MKKLAVVLCGTLAACGGGTKKSTLPKEKNIVMPAEDFAVQPPPRPVVYDFDADNMEGVLYLPEGEATPPVLAQPASALPKGKAGKDLKARRAAFEKAKPGKDKVREAEWLTTALLAAAVAGDIAQDDAWKDARAALDAVVTDPAAGETTWQMAAVARQVTKDLDGSAQAWQKLIEAFPQSAHLDDYKHGLAGVLFASGQHKKAALALGKIGDKDAWGQYWSAWSMMDESRWADAATQLETALKLASADKRLSAAMRKDLIHTIAWRGGEAPAIITEVKGLGGVPALSDLVMAADYLADRGELGSSSAVFREILQDPGITPAQINHAYEVITQDALAGRRLDDLAAAVEELLGRVDKYGAGDDADRAAEVGALIATTLHGEWTTTREDSSEKAVKRLYAALTAHAGLSKKVDVSKQARDFEEQEKSPDKVPGEAAKELIRRTVRLSMNGLRHCYELGLVGNPKLEGTVNVTFSPNPDGSTTVAEITGGGFSPEDTACMKKAIESWRFPAHPKRAVITVHYPITFHVASP
jgi:hypothetical protein